MDAVLTAIRALHFGACIVLFGGFAFACCVSPDGRPPPRFFAVGAWSLALAVATALAWLAVEAGNMSGEPIGRALGDGTLAIVLARTLFGQVWIARAALAALLALALLAMRGREGGARRGIAQAAGAASAALLLVTLSCVGHAAGDLRGGRVAHLFADGVHLLAAGAWLGALLPLASLLRESAPGELARASLAVRRFSLLGIACVGALLLSGIVNTAYAVHHVRALFASRYGSELAVKLVLFAAIVALAAVNRWRLTPRLESPDAACASAARRSLLANALAEVALGFAIVAIVGNLGITMPPMHAG